MRLLSPWLLAFGPLVLGASVHGLCSVALAESPGPPPAFQAERATPAADPPLSGPPGWSSHIVGPRMPGLGHLPAGSAKTIPVATVDELAAAVASAQPGTVIEIRPGVYEFAGKKVEVDRPGRADLPIILRASALGSVRLRFALLEGFHVLAPYWTFENLVIEGVCEKDSQCEHAFHVVGNAVGVIIQNNHVSDFNAAVKVNGKDGRYPDDGIIRNNAFLNSRPRNTDRPVTVLDFVSVSRWRVQRNLIADFAKAGGNYTSYGAFFKGAGEGNVFEQNLVRCEWHHSGLFRIGFSFGDGGTARRFCRDGSCSAEHRGGVARNNVILDCPNQAGIFLSKSAGTLLHNNALIATRGIELRHPATDATILNNIVDGGIRAREGAAFTAAGNIVAPPEAPPPGSVSGNVYVDARGGDLRLKHPREVAGRGIPVQGSSRDLCGQPYGEAPPDIGPIQYASRGDCLPRLW